MTQKNVTIFWWGWYWLTSWSNPSNEVTTVRATWVVDLAALTMKSTRVESKQWLVAALSQTSHIFPGHPVCECQNEPI